METATHALRYTSTREDILQAVEKAVRAVSPKSTLPILGNILLGVTPNGALTATGYDLETGIQCATGHKDEVAAQGEVTVPAKAFRDLLKSLPKGAAVTLAQTTGSPHGDAGLRVTSSGRESVLLGLPADEYPRLPDPGVTLATVALTGAEVLDIGWAHRASEHGNGAHPIMEGVLLCNYAGSCPVGLTYGAGTAGALPPEGTVAAVATDGPRLHLARGIGTISPSDDTFAAILAPAFVALLSKLGGPTGRGTNAAQGGAVLTFGGHVVSAYSQSTGETTELQPTAPTYVRAELAGATVICSRLVPGRYPNWERVIPATCRRFVTLEVDAAREALGQVASVALEDGNKVAIDLSGDSVRFSAHSQELGDSSATARTFGARELDEERREEHPATPFRFAANARYLGDALAGFSGGTVTVETREPDSAFVLRREGSPRYALVMPMVLDMEAERERDAARTVAVAREFNRLRTEMAATA